MQDYGKNTALFRHDYAQPDAIRSRRGQISAVISPKSAKLDGYEPPTTEIYAILRKIWKLGALRPKICDLWPIFQLFRLTGTKNDTPGQGG